MVVVCDWCWWFIESSIWRLCVLLLLWFVVLVWGGVVLGFTLFELFGWFVLFVVIIVCWVWVCLGFGGLGFGGGFVD